MFSEDIVTRTPLIAIYGPNETSSWTAEDLAKIFARKAIDGLLTGKLTELDQPPTEEDMQEVRDRIWERSFYFGRLAGSFAEKVLIERERAAVQRALDADVMPVLRGAFGGAK